MSRRVVEPNPHGSGCAGGVRFGRAVPTWASPGPWREPETKLGRGHGLVIIRALTEVEIDAAGTSLDLRMRLRLSTS